MSLFCLPVEISLFFLHTGLPRPHYHNKAVPNAHNLWLRYIEIWCYLYKAYFFSFLVLSKKSIYYACTLICVLSDNPVVSEVTTSAPIWSWSVLHSKISDIGKLRHGHIYFINNSWMTDDVVSWLLPTGFPMNFDNRTKLKVYRLIKFNATAFHLSSFSL